MNTPLDHSSPFLKQPSTLSHRLCFRAFTLVELLVVISIIAVLAAILLSVTSKMRSAANATKCVANLKQIGVQFHSYANENDGNFTSFFGPWDEKLIDGLNARDSTKIWRCPVDKVERKRGKKWTSDSSFVAPARSYLINAFAVYLQTSDGHPHHRAYEGQPEWGPTNHRRIDNPSKMWLLGEVMQPSNETYDYVFGESSASASGSSTYPHNGSSNVLMVDGRVVTVKAADGEEFFRANARGNVPWYPKRS